MLSQSLKNSGFFLLLLYNILMIYLNDMPITVTMFPDNTSQVWKLPENILRDETHVYIKWDFTHEGEFMHLAQLVMLLRANCITSSLYMTYLPYGRQDKKVRNDSTFALRSFSKLLNSLEFEKISVLDPHSKEAEKLVFNLTSYYEVHNIKQVLKLTGTNLVCYPDKGALDKYNSLMLYRSVVYGKKTRNQLTGDIEHYEVVGDYNYSSRILIVDDICDGGATFVLLAKQLLTKGTEEVNMFVTHGIFSKGLKPLKDAGINRIFTKNGEAFETNGIITYRSINESDTSYTSL